ncbi:MAG: response regulator [Chthoniobacterales bacterium]|nr:response regulator [Chthoniobacterales bacterium]
MSSVPAPSAPSPDIVIPDLRGAPEFRVIVGEDDPVSREILSALLQKWRFSVLTASDGREAMELLRAQTAPVLAVLDWMMPGLEGTEICRRVREINKSVYIILLTARTSKERIGEALEAGADDYLAKPFDKGELRARLNVGLRLLSLQASLAARIEELEATQAENRELKLRIPL